MHVAFLFFLFESILNVFLSFSAVLSIALFLVICSCCWTFAGHLWYKVRQKFCDLINSSSGNSLFNMWFSSNASFLSQTELR